MNENTLWIITSDHGEGLGNHDCRSHGRHIYNEQLWIPLLFHVKSHRFPVKKVGALVRTVDLLPTLADILGKEMTGERPVEGASLLPLVTDRSGDSTVLLE